MLTGLGIYDPMRMDFSLQQEGMIVAVDNWPLPADEALRLEVLPSYGLIGSDPEPVYDSLTKRLADLLDVPICLITVIGEKAQWIKSGYGVDLQATPRCQAFCAHTITQDELLLVPDASTDVRFRSNPLVTGEPHIRFYAGFPIITGEGAHIGAICTIDTKPRRFVDTGLLAATSAVIAELFNHRLTDLASAGETPALFGAERSAIVRAAQILHAQSTIGTYFDADLFGNPTLSMLLALFIAAREGRSLSISECCEAANLPFSTGQRLINRLCASGTVELDAHSHDKRRRNVTAPVSTQQKIEDWLLSV